MKEGMNKKRYMFQCGHQLQKLSFDLEYIYSNINSDHYTEAVKFSNEGIQEFTTDGIVNMKAEITKSHEIINDICSELEGISLLIKNIKVKEITNE